MKTRSYPRYVKLPDNNGNFTRVAKAWKFRDSSRIYYFEPLFLLSGGVIVRKDALFEDDEIFSMKGCGFLRYYVAVAQRPNLLKILESPLNLLLNGDFLLWQNPTLSRN